MPRPVLWRRPTAAGEPVAASAASGVAFVAAVWLAPTPSALDFAPGEGFEGCWRDIVAGAAIAPLSLVRSLAPHKVPWLSLVNVMLGVWLLFAQVVLGYRPWPGSTAAAGNTIVVGLIVIAKALFSTYVTCRRRARDDPSKDVS